MPSPLNLRLARISLNLRTYFPSLHEHLPILGENLFAHQRNRWIGSRNVGDVFGGCKTCLYQASKHKNNPSACRRMEKADVSVVFLKTPENCEAVGVCSWLSRKPNMVGLKHLVIRICLSNLQEGARRYRTGTFPDRFNLRSGICYGFC